MLNSSLRRAARSCPGGHPLPSRPTTPSIASFHPKSHQRRHSSSKPPVPPNNGSPGIPAASVKQVAASRSDVKKPTEQRLPESPPNNGPPAVPASSVKQVGVTRPENKKMAAEPRLSKRKTAKSEVKEEVIVDNWTSTLPRVPSLHHLTQKDINASAFYATYRPICITGPGPKESQIDDIEKLFAPKPKPKSKPAPSEVIYTLSSALEGLNDAIADKQAAEQDSSVTQKADLIKTLTQHNDSKITHLDGQQTLNVRVPSGAVKLVLQEIVNRFRPFNVPPPPAPVSQQELDAINAEQSAVEANEELMAKELEAQVEQQDAETVTAEARKLRKELEVQIAQQDNNTEIAEVVLNVRDGTLQSGQFFTPRVQIEDTARVQHIADPSPSPPDNRVGNRRRRGVYVPLRRRPGMQAISVKRQRKLKMKKHKYKKLMRKTRNLRRRQDRL